MVFPIYNDGGGILGLVGNRGGDGRIGGDAFASILFSLIVKSSIFQLGLQLIAKTGGFLKRTVPVFGDLIKRRSFQYRFKVRAAQIRVVLGGFENIHHPARRAVHAYKPDTHMCRKSAQKHAVYNMPPKSICRFMIFYHVSHAGDGVFRKNRDMSVDYLLGVGGRFDEAGLDAVISCMAQNAQICEGHIVVRMCFAV